MDLMRLLRRSLVSHLLPYNQPKAPFDSLPQIHLLHSHDHSNSRIRQAMKQEQPSSIVRSNAGFVYKTVLSHGLQELFSCIIREMASCLQYTTMYSPRQDAMGIPKFSHSSLA